MNATEIKNNSVSASRRGIKGLIFLNAMLLALLVWITFGASADAQGSRRGDYTMVAGGVNGSESGAVWIVNGAAQELIAVTYDSSQKNIVPIGYRSLEKDMANWKGRR